MLTCILFEIFAKTITKLNCGGKGMVKGVNKTIIEVNNTGSRLFEKIVFYVTPEYGNLNAKQLRKAASAFSFNFQTDFKSKSIRQLHKRRRLFTASILLTAILGVIITALIIIL